MQSLGHYSITGFEAHQETEVTPGWISAFIFLFELWSQNLLSSNSNFLKFHYEAIVILPWLIIVIYNIKCDIYYYQSSHGISKTFWGSLVWWRGLVFLSMCHF